MDRHSFSRSFVQHLLSLVGTVCHYYGYTKPTIKKRLAKRRAHLRIWLHALGCEVYRGLILHFSFAATGGEDFSRPIEYDRLKRACLSLSRA